MDTEQQVRLNFLEEAEEYFAQLEAVLLDLARADNRSQPLNEALRAAHSIKGSAGMMGFMPLARVAHRLEDFLKILQARQLEFDPELETLLLCGVDCLRDVKQLHLMGKHVDDAWWNQHVEPIFAQLKQRLGDLTEDDENRLLSADEDVDVGILVFVAGIEEVLNQFETQRPHGSNLQQALADTTNRLMEFGFIGQVEPFVSLCESVQERLKTIGPAELPAFTDAVISLWWQSHALVALGRVEQVPDRIDWLTNLPEVSFEVSLADLSSLQANLAALVIPDDYAVLVSEPVILPVIVPEPIPQPEVVPPLGKKRANSAATVRVPLEQFRQINMLFSSLILERNAINSRLNQMQDLMGLLHDRMQHLDGFNQELREWYDQSALEAPVSQDLVTTGFDALEMDNYSNLHLIAQSQMETIVKLQEVIADIDLNGQEMQQANSNLNYTSRSLQTRITRAQMRPFADIVGRFPRVVRDLALQYGKQVNLKIAGESTLFERFALDALTDPLNHLLRNAFDHGIEAPEVRVQSGKSAAGTITLRAMQQGNKAIVTIQDDGKGINLAKIRDRVRQHGIPEHRVNELSRRELLDLIFEPGFSTADKVTELSGRGVGMDVVRSNLQQVQGDVQVDTEPGVGTTFTISIPLTLSILRVMILETGGLVFAVPIELVTEVLPLHAAASNAGQPMVIWQDQTIPIAMLDHYWQFYSAASLMEMPGTPMIEHPMMLVVTHQKQHYAFQVQRFWGEQEVGIRPVNSPLPLPEGFSGVTVLGDGRIVPMIDPIVLFEQVEQARSQTQKLDCPIRLGRLERPMVIANRILVVDDSVHARRYLAISLEKAGYQVEQAKDGQEAVDRLLAGLQVAAVICDVEMPRLDGYGVLSAIKSRSEFRDLPIAMLTSRSSEKHRKLAMNLGATAYFSKPYNEPELLQTLAGLVA
jgi:two-component system, chemotaxis family, sensor histidine kinase and response regulator PixL